VLSGRGAELTTKWKTSAKQFHEPQEPSSGSIERQTARGLFCGKETQSRTGIVKFFSFLSFAHHTSTFLAAILLLNPANATRG
jgi:hypothetical protein